MIKGTHYKYLESDDPKLEEIRKLAPAGISYSKIADAISLKFGVAWDAGWVQRLCQRHGIEHKSAYNKPKRLGLDEGVSSRKGVRKA